jgi:hypothetical protein
MGPLCQFAVAQTYKQIDKAIVDAKQVSQLRRDVSPIIRSTAALTASDKDTLQKFYVYHVVAGMTRPEALQDPQQFPSWRKTVLSDLASPGMSEEKHDYIRDLVYRSASMLVQDRTYSPFCRYNALLLIGGLNQREAQGTRPTMTPAVPYAPARQLMLKVLGGDEPQEMKVGALIGLARHARLLAAGGENPDSSLVRTFIDVLKQKDPRSNGTLDGMHWMHRIAIDSLGDVGMPAAAKMLGPILSDPATPMPLRCAAADSVGRLDYSGAVNVDHAGLLKGLGQLAAAALAEQIQGLQQYIKDNPPDSFREAPAGASSDEVPEDPYVQRVRRQLKYQLLCIDRALRTIEQATTDAAVKNTLTAIKSAIAALLKELDNKNLQPQELLDKIGPPAMLLEDAVKKL